MPKKYTPTEAASAFWSRVDRSRGEDACWPWTGPTAHEYGRCWWIGRCAGAHRVAYELCIGPIPTGPGYHGICILHRCDNPKCCNPSHLFLGSHLDNMRDKIAKGRQSQRLFVVPASSRQRGDDHWSRTSPEFLAVGSANGNAKLDDQAVISMRRARTTGETFRSIARRFGVSCPTAQDAISGRTWKHLP